MAHHDLYNFSSELGLLQQPAQHRPKQDKWIVPCSTSRTHFMVELQMPVTLAHCISDFVKSSRACPEQASLDPCSASSLLLLDQVSQPADCHLYLQKCHSLHCPLHMMKLLQLQAQRAMEGCSLTWRGSPQMLPGVCCFRLPSSTLPTSMAAACTLQLCRQPWPRNAA